MTEPQNSGTIKQIITCDFFFVVVLRCFGKVNETIQKFIKHAIKITLFLSLLSCDSYYNSVQLYYIISYVMTVRQALH